jgi:DNA-binding response OmpR family regulator
MSALRVQRVLVVEDDWALGVFLKKGLQQEGHRVELAGDGDQAIAGLQAEPPDLVVLDLSLPGRDGLEVLEALRLRCPETAVLVLTGRSHVEERVRCLNLGADDYLLKPFSFHELVARCRAILRRAERAGSPQLRFAGITMNRVERSVVFRGLPVELTGKEFALLEALLRRQGQCCSRQELLQEVWQGKADAGANVLEVYMTYLRRKLGGADGGEINTAEESVIETVRGLGYRLRGERKPPMAVRAPVGSGSNRLARGAV